MQSEPLLWSPGTGVDVWNMFCAAITGDVESICRLLEKEPSLVRCSYEYRTPLAFAVQENQIDAAACLFDRGARTFGNPLEIARDRGFIEMERMLEARISRATGFCAGGEQIAKAIRERDLAQIRSLLERSPELVHAADERSNRPIHWAVMTRQIDVIDELLARGADVNSRRDDGALPIQLTNGDYLYRGWIRDFRTGPREVLDHLRARGADCDICTAAYIGDESRVRDLLAEDPSLANRPSEYVSHYACSGTPLRNAASAGNLDIVRLLLEHGADPNLPEEGIAPRGHALYAAVYHGHFEVARLLLEEGAYPNVPVESYFEIDLAAWKSGASSVEALRSQVKKHLNSQSDAGTADDTLTLGGARSLTARWHGFRSWEALRQAVGRDCARLSEDGVR